MGPAVKLLLIIVLFATLLQYYCYGSSVVAEGARDAELEKQLKVLNKPPSKSIRMEVGDVFDCIDINKQPSLHHPLLKNHVIKTRPIAHSINTTVDDDHKPVLSSSSSSSSSMKHSSGIEILKKLNCPNGTVPIRRTFKEDLMRAKVFPQSQLVHYGNMGERDDLENPGEGQFLSIAKTRKDSGINYLGISAYINTYNPPVADDQVSTAQVWIENGSKEEFNSLQAGWIVAPSLYGDNKTRLFGKWQVDGPNKNEGCYNILCPGFIQVNNDHPIDGAVSKISQFGGFIQYDIGIAISQDGGGNWWLSIDETKIGYWPAELGFSQLTQGSSVIAWGGLAAQLGAVTTSVPPTGNGHYPHSPFNYHKQCYMRQMKVMPMKTLYWEDPTNEIIDTFETKENCSKILYHGRHGIFFQHALAFGGPGGNCQF